MKPQSAEEWFNHVERVMPIYASLLRPGRYVIGFIGWLVSQVGWIVLDKPRYTLKQSVNLEMQAFREGFCKTVEQGLIEKGWACHVPRFQRLFKEHFPDL